MARDDKLDLGIPERLENVQVFFAWNRKDSFDSFILKRCYKQVRPFFVDRRTSALLTFIRYN
jgi:hypothetical protein